MTGFPLWVKEIKTGQTLLDVIMHSNSASITESIACAPVTDKDISDFLSLDRLSFSVQSYRLLRQWFLHCCIRHNINWAFLRLCCADVVNSGPLPDGTTCLDTAVEHRRSLCVRYILHKYMTPDDSWDRARNVAVAKGYDEIVEMIHHRQTELQRNASMGRNRLHLAVTDDDSDMVLYILRNGLVDPVGDKIMNTPLCLAVANRKDECANLFKDHHNADGINTINKHGQTVLHSAVAGRMEVLPVWLIGGPQQMEQRDCEGLTALQQAVVANMEGIASQLVASGANHRSVIRVNLSSPRIRTGLPEPRSSCEHLQLTSQENSASLCLKLHGRVYPRFLDYFTTEDANFFDRNDNSLLHLTALLMDSDGCKRLLEKGAAVDALNKYKNTPLMELLVYLHRNRCGKGIDDKALMTIRCLIDGGGNIAKEPDNRKTALQMVMEFLDERLLLEIVRQNPPIDRLTPTDFGKCIENKMFNFLEKVVPQMSVESCHECICTSKIRQCMVTAPHSTLVVLFAHAQSNVQEEVIDELLCDAACREDTECFDRLLPIHNAKWKRMPNGESILTALLKEGKKKFCEKLLQMPGASALIELTNKDGSSPLMVAIAADVDEGLVNGLIHRTQAVNCENSTANTALTMLFEKVSTATGEKRNKLKSWTQDLISRSADIYRVNRHNKAAITFCTSKELRSEFEHYFDRHQRPESTSPTRMDSRAN